MSNPKIIPREEVKRMTEGDIRADINLVIEEILPQLRTGEKTRLFKAYVKYPFEEVEFDEGEPLLRQAFTVLKRLNDTQVALGVEVVIEQLLNDQQGENNESETSTKE